MHTQTGVKFEIDNITDLFWEQRPRLGCAGALFFKFENRYILMHVPNLQVPLNSHLTHTHISGLFGSASLLAFQVECLYFASASKRRPFMSSVLRDSNRTPLPNFLLVKETSPEVGPNWDNHSGEKILGYTGMIPEDSDSWLITARLPCPMRYDVFICFQG